MLNDAGFATRKVRRSIDSESSARMKAINRISISSFKRQPGPESCYNWAHRELRERLDDLFYKKMPKYRRHNELDLKLDVMRRGSPTVEVKARD